jgi:phosphatidylglycerophosphate synthase
MNATPSRLAALGLIAGASLLAVTLVMTDLRSIGDFAVRLGTVLPLALLPGALWHALRTEAWRRCFPEESRPSFARSFRIRLAAEAFSYLTIRGVAGEPLKIVLLQDEVVPPISAAAVALERIAYILVTSVLVGALGLTALAVLPLTPGWRLVFSLVSGFALLALAAVFAFASLNQPPRREADSTSHKASAALARFVSELHAQFQHLVSGDRRRLAMLILFESLAYAMMALEVWIVLWAVGTPIGIVDAFAAETLTRVASLASAFIPGNLGALEASNVAAAAAVNAAGGAVALALLRRIRGLFWCAAGFLVYPSRSAPKSAARGNLVLAIIADVGSDEMIGAQLGGLPLGERVLRSAIRAGYSRVAVWTPWRQLRWEALARRLNGRVELTATNNLETWRRSFADPFAAVTIVLPGIVPSPALLASAAKVAPTEDQPLLEIRLATDQRQTGVLRAFADQVATGSLISSAVAFGNGVALRHGDRPGDVLPSLRVCSRADLVKAERQLRKSIFQPTDCEFGRFNRRMSIPISVRLIEWTRFNPHAMSLLLIGLGLCAGWLFSRGSYGSGVLAALLSVAASILGGCDGELARLQYKESRLGCWLDTLGDYIYYFAIFIGLAIGVSRHSHSDFLWWAGMALLLGMLLTFAILILLRWRITSGRPERLRTTTRAHFYGTGKRWAWLAARLSNCATRATMPYGILGFAVLGALPVVIVVGAVGAQMYWTFRFFNR